MTDDQIEILVNAAIVARDVGDALREWAHLLKTNPALPMRSTAAGLEANAVRLTALQDTLLALVKEAR